MKAAKPMKNESDVKDEVKRILKGLGRQVWYFMPVPNGFGVQGVPDFICCVRGNFVAIETKFGKNTTSAWQEKQIAGIQDASGSALVVNELTVDTLEAYLRAIIAMEE